MESQDTNSKDDYFWLPAVGPRKKIDILLLGFIIVALVATASIAQIHVNSDTAISNLGTKLTAAYEQITKDNATISNESSTIVSLDKIISYGYAVPVVSGVNVMESSSDPVPTIAVYNCSQSGYLLISGTTTASNGSILVAQTVDGYHYAAHYLAGPTNTTLDINGSYFTNAFNIAAPVTAGFVTIYFTSSDQSYDSATVTVTYVY